MLVPDVVELPGLPERYVVDSIGMGHDGLTLCLSCRYSQNTCHGAIPQTLIT